MAQNALYSESSWQNSPWPWRDSLETCMEVWQPQPGVSWSSVTGEMVGESEEAASHSLSAHKPCNLEEKETALFSFCSLLLPSRVVRIKEGDERLLAILSCPYAPLGSKEPEQNRVVTEGSPPLPLRRKRRDRSDAMVMHSHFFKKNPKHKQ